MINKNLVKAVLFCLIGEIPCYLHAQEKMPVKFGKVTPDDFKATGAALDTGAEAVIIADFGNSSIEGNNRGDWELTFKRSRRIRILKRTGFEAATVSIPLYVSGSDAEKVVGLKAATYVFKDGKVIETKLDSKSIFIDKVSKSRMVEKFTFPALEEGAILEYSYSLISPFVRGLQPWEFQGAYPCLWSEYDVDMPNFLKYVTMAKGYLPFKVNTNDSHMQTFHVTDPGGATRDDHYTFDDEVHSHRWVMVNVPAMKTERFTTTVDNYVSKVEFQLSGYQYPGGIYHNMTDSWTKLSDELMKADYFGGDLAKGNSWMDDDVKSATKGAGNAMEKAEGIYAFVRDNFTSTSHSGLVLSDGLRTAYKNRSGNVADVNLVLTAMLIHAGFNAVPVILSTRSNGTANPLYPMVSDYNYVICEVTIDSKRYNLDASERWLGFGRLPERCYNGGARIIDIEKPYLVPLSADSLEEASVTLAIVSNDEKGGLTARFRTVPGNQGAEEVRQEVKEHGQDAYLKKIQSSYSGDATVSNLELDSLRKPDEPLSITYDLHLTPDATTDVIYFNPMLGEGTKENPFKAAVRTYPVEMPYAMDESYILTMDIPTGYVVDELPKSAKVTFNGEEGFFEYLMAKTDQQVQFRTRIKLRKANFTPEDYDPLREFFGYIVKKQSEQIVFKKK
jgi:hypothetical protein